MAEVALPVADRTGIAAAGEDERILVATQWQLIWWRFRKHYLAVGGSVVVILFYLVAFNADLPLIFRPIRFPRRSISYPSPANILVRRRRISSARLQMKGSRNPKTFVRDYEADPNDKIYLRLFGSGFRYKILGFIQTDIHLFGVVGERPEETLFILGTDIQGRDLWSRLINATRISLFIGLAGVTISLFLGILLGGLSGFYGGFVDTVIQRIIEILRSIPTIPLWMGLAAAMPRDWDILKVYFAITIIISLIGWTDLARVVRGKFLSIREEDFVTAAELAGASRLRIIFRHMVPAFLSHIIASITLAIPFMIIAETSLSFLGLGLRPPAISWGVLLQDAQNIQALAITPWLLIPAIPVVFVILAFNFMGDGIRDAADPYSS